MASEAISVSMVADTSTPTRNLEEDFHLCSITYILAQTQRTNNHDFQSPFS